ncbi:SusD/RagB family nutrient-binding outer membrane lipoprotein [Foetidibacter luteolus]|uniref:SusD/RagB family nutrient-binding outer membrane lipoprotein n=1 Tax=Foetidibacter luteolus TaxID=2608880 RepID=UPI00129AAE28|nr:SusD/RagB family nutrient-binding outer membrane lipoprotein [Foetidibacter luteolus]
MKKKKYLIYGAMFLLLGNSCKKADFVEDNTNPNILYGIEPQEQFLNTAIQIHGQDFEAFYDSYRRIMPWMQMNTAQNGNAKTFLNDVGNFNSRYGIFYPTLGAQIADLNALIALKPESERPAYVHMAAIAEIVKSYYGFYVSDINGSLAYSEAFQGRYGGTLTPKYESQQELFQIFETKLKESIATLKATQPVTQVSLGNNDLWFKGEAVKWVRVANALRLRIAMRLLKRDEATAKAIFADVLADGEQMASNADGWVLYADETFTSGGNWDITTFRAPKPTVDFMLKNSDPRVRLYYQPNNYSEENFEIAKDSGLYPANAVWNPNQYVGAPISPDDATGAYQSWFTVKRVSASLSLDTLSFLNYRMWQPANNGGDGVVTLPLITYADYCFMRAEIAARGLASGNAEEWYNKGIEASITFFDNAGSIAKLANYRQLSADEIDNYKNAADVKFNAAKAVEQIAIQQYINFYKQPNEAWALFKRTGIPNKNTALANVDLIIDASVRQIPRRAALSIPAATDLNAANKQAALDAMAQDADFGSGPTDLFGRVWWDKK